jgi:hypothetical protein
MSRFQNLFNTVMTDHVQEKLEMSRKHLDAYRRGGLGMPQASEGEEMKITSAGDVHYYHPPQPVAQPQQKSSLLPTLLALGLGMLGPAGAVGGYFLKEFLQSEKPVANSPTTIQNTIREEMKIRLLTEDELKQP